MRQNRRKQPKADGVLDANAGDAIHSVEYLASSPEVFWDFLGLMDGLPIAEIIRFGSSPFIVPSPGEKNKLWPRRLRNKWNKAVDARRKAMKRRTSSPFAVLDKDIALQDIRDEARRDWVLANRLLRWHAEVWRRWLVYLEVRNEPLTAQERRTDARKIWDAVVDPRRARLLARHERGVNSARACRKTQPHDDILRLDEIVARSRSPQLFDEEAWPASILQRGAKPEAGGVDEIASDAWREFQSIWLSGAFDPLLERLGDLAAQTLCPEWQVDLSREPMEEVLASDDDDDIPVPTVNYATLGVYFLRAGRDRPISNPTDSRVARAAKELDAADRRLRKIAGVGTRNLGSVSDDISLNDTEQEATRQRELAAEKSRILNELRVTDGAESIEVQAFLKKHAVFSSSFANEPPDPRPPREWGDDNAEALQCALDRERVHKEVMSAHRVRFCLGKLDQPRPATPYLSNIYKTSLSYRGVRNPGPVHEKKQWRDEWCPVSTLQKAREAGDLLRGSPCRIGVRLPEIMWKDIARAHGIYWLRRHRNAHQLSTDCDFSHELAWYRPQHLGEGRAIGLELHIGRGGVVRVLPVRPARHFVVIWWRPPIRLRSIEATPPLTTIKRATRVWLPGVSCGRRARSRVEQMHEWQPHRAPNTDVQNTQLTDNGARIVWLHRLPHMSDKDYAHIMALNHRGKCPVSSFQRTNLYSAHESTLRWWLPVLKGGFGQLLPRKGVLLPHPVRELALVQFRAQWAPNETAQRTALEGVRAQNKGRLPHSQDFVDKTAPDSRHKAKVAGFVEVTSSRIHGKKIKRGGFKPWSKD